MPSVYPRRLKSGLTYYARVKRAGRWFSYNTGLDTEKDALQHARIVQAKLDRGENPFASDTPIVTVKAWGERYLTAMAPNWSNSTLVSRSATLRRLEPLCGGADISAVAEILNALRSSMAGLSPHSVNIHLRNVRAFLNWVAEQEPTFKPPRIREVKAPREREHDYLTEDELAAVLSELADKTINGQPVAPFVEFCALTGLRRGEAIAFKRSWVKDGLIRVPALVSKTDTARYIPVTPKIEALLPADSWQGINEKVSKLFRAAVIRAGITRPLKFHNLRDTFIVTAIKRGVPIAMVARIAGHDVRTLMANYAHFAEDDFRQIATMLQPDTASNS